MTLGSHVVARQTQLGVGFLVLVYMPTNISLCIADSITLRILTKIHIFRLPYSREPVAVAIIVTKSAAI